jgi:hypothetical protein
MNIRTSPRFPVEKYMVIARIATTPLATRKLVENSFLSPSNTTVMVGIIAEKRIFWKFPRINVARACSGAAEKRGIPPCLATPQRNDVVNMKKGTSKTNHGLVE